MRKNIYVGNLRFDTTPGTLQALFEAYGQVAKINLVRERHSGHSRGFAFVEMVTNEAARAAIVALNGHEIDGRALQVNAAKSDASRGADRGRRDGRRR